MSDHPVPDDAVTAAAKKDTLVPDFPDLGRGIPGHDAWVAIAPAGSVERIAAQARQEEVRERVAEQDAMHADLGELLEILGLGNYARPQSPQEVFRMCLAKLREQSDAAYRNPDGSYHTSPPLAERDDAIAAQGAAAERERWRNAIAERTTTLWRPGMGHSLREGVQVVLVRDLADLIGETP